MLESNLVIPNPKNSRNGASRLYRYYAAYSGEFAQIMLSQLAPSNGALVLDPWDGSGTTTAAASNLGFKAIGLDLNPATRIVAHARFSSQADAERVKKALELLPLNGVPARQEDWSEDDLLTSWFTPNTVRTIRSIQKLAQDRLQDSNRVSRKTSNALTFLAVSLFQLVLFRTVRQLARQFFASNPTWISIPRAEENKVDCSAQDFVACLSSEISYISPLLRQDPISRSALPHLQIAESQALPLASESVGVILTSPPYCTRIDYAMATKLELAVLGLTKLEFSRLRIRLMGTTLTEKTVIQHESSWGPTCSYFLNQVKKHPSAASSTYYYRGFLRYFADFFASIAEISRVLIHNGSAVIVIRDSYYKDLHIDLSSIVQEMCQNCGLMVLNAYDFEQRSFGAINHRSHNRRKKAVETVLIASK